MKYICMQCGYIYDEAIEKKPFAELPYDWKCPVCGASKASFKLNQKSKMENDEDNMK